MATNGYIIKCDGCGAKNRVPANRIQDNPVCGKCGAPINTNGVYLKPVIISDATFDKEVLNHKGPVLVDYWAPWCGPCSAVGPVLDTLAENYAGQIKIAKVNIDENQVTASKYSIQSVPTMMIFNNGQIVDTIIGAQPQTVIENLIRKAI